MKSAFTFGPSFQDTMLAMMIDDPSFAVKAVGRVPVDKLYSAGHKWLFEVFQKCIKDKGQVPSLPEVEDSLKLLDPSKRRLFYTFVKKIYTETKITDPNYIKEQLADYAKKNDFIEVFMGAQTLWNSREHEKALELVMEGMNDIYAISFHDDMNVTIDDFEKLRAQHIAKGVIGTVKVPTMIEPLDEQLNGGLEKKEMGIILADPKKGKSIGLIHMGCAALMTRRGRVAHFVLEGTTEQTIMRYESRLSNILYSSINKDELNVNQRKKLDDLKVKYTNRLELVPMNTRWDYTVLDIEAKLKHMIRTGNKPDLVVIDYGDLLTSHVKGLDKRHEQTNVYRALKQLAMIYDVAVWTASQAVRPAGDLDKPNLLRAKDISESYEKVRIADLVMTLNQTPKEKGEGLMRLHLDIYRSNEFDRTIRMVQDYSRMIFYSKRYQHIEKDEIPSWLTTKKKSR